MADSSPGLRDLPLCRSNDKPIGERLSLIGPRLCLIYANGVTYA